MSLKQKLVNGAICLGVASAVAGVVDVAYNVYEFDKAKKEVIARTKDENKSFILTDGRNTYDLRPKTDNSKTSKEIYSLSDKYADKASLGLEALAVGGLITMSAIFAGAIIKKRGEEQNDRN